MSNLKFDILICGAGLVGTSLALALADLPLRIALVEAAPIKTDLAITSDSRSLALTYASVRFLSTIKVWQAIEQFAAPIKMVHVSERGHFGITRIKASEENVPALGYIVPAPTLGNMLNTALLNSKHLSLLNPASVKMLTALPQGWEITIETEGKCQTVTADLVVAADGSHSSIRKLLNITVQEKDYAQSALATSITLARTHNYTAYERFTEQGTLAILPRKDLQCGLIWTAANAQIQKLAALTDTDFLHNAQHYFGYRLGKFLHVGKKHIYPLKMLYAEQQIKPGFVLIGNAAHTFHPVAAQGLNLGLIDVALLVEAITKAIPDHQALSSISYLQEYADAAQKIQQRIMQFTHNLTHIFEQDILPLALARNSGIFALNMLPLIKHKLAKRLMGVG